MDLFWPDRSEFQGRARATGAVALCARASEGNWLEDPEYQWNKAEAALAGAIFWGYHFLEAYSGAASQAAFCHSIVGRTPLMLDFEPIAGATPPGGRAASGGRKPAFFTLRRAVSKGSYPAVSLALAFIDSYRALGGTCHVVYLPRWYHQALGSPSLQGFRDRGCVLVSSQYTAYSDTGPGWQPYAWRGGSWTPKIWQYSDSVNFNGVITDFNAFKSSASTVTGAVAELESWVRAGRPPAPPGPPPAPASLPVPLMSGDAMFYLPNGAGAVVSIPVPVAVLRADGSTGPPSQIRFGTNAACEVATNTDKTGWIPFPIDGNRSPNVVPLPAGAREVEVQRVDTGRNLITADFA